MARRYHECPHRAPDAVNGWSVATDGPRQLSLLQAGSVNSPPGPGGGSHGDPDFGSGESEVTDAGEAVELLLEEVGEETEAQPVRGFGELRGRTALVTGGATGIGRCTAIELARRGVNIAFNWVELEGRSIAEAAAATERELQQLEVRVCAEPVDVRDASAVRSFVDRIRERLGGVHFLVNAAGVHRSAPIWKMSESAWQEVLDVNLTGAFNTTRAVAPVFREQRYGKIVNVSSVHAFRGHFGVANYAAAKAGLIALTRVTATELGPTNVNVNAVAPGFVRTEMLSDVPEERVQESEDRAALRRISEPEEVAHVIVFLCSEMARQISGQVIRVDGGLVA